MKFGGLKVVEDTGAPAGVENYKTLILVHGFGMHSGMLCHRRFRFWVFMQ